MRENNYRQNALILLVTAVIALLIISVNLPANQEAVKKVNSIIVLTMHGTHPYTKIGIALMGTLRNR